MSNLNVIQRVILSIVLLLVTGSTLFYAVTLLHKQKIIDSNSNGQKLFFGNELAGPLKELSISKSIGKPQDSSVPGISQDSLIDIARGVTKTFYLVRSQDKKSTNIYFADTSDSKQTLHEVSFSSTWKFQLSYNEPSHTLAYTSIPDNSWKSFSSSTQPTVSVLNTLTNSVKNLGNGSNPVVLPGGNYVLFRDTENRSISIISIATGKKTHLISIDLLSPFAISSDRKTLVIYNSLSQQVMYYDINQILSVSYLHSEPTPFTPIVMTYGSGNRLLLGGISNTDPSTLDIQFIDAKTLTTQVTNIFKIPYPEYIEFNYE